MIYLINFLSHFIFFILDLSKKILTFKNFNNNILDL
jgi:hypothetical protein